MNAIYVLNLISLAVIVLCCLFVILHPKIILKKTWEALLWVMVFISAGMFLEGMDFKLDIRAAVGFRVVIALMTLFWVRRLWIGVEKQ